MKKHLHVIGEGQTCVARYQVDRFVLSTGRKNPQRMSLNKRQARSVLLCLLPHFPDIERAWVNAGERRAKQARTPARPAGEA